MQKSSTRESLERKSGQGSRCILAVRVQPGAAKTELKSLMPDKSIRVGVKAPPIEGKANAELVQFLRRLFGVPSSAVRIVKGFRSRQKSVVIEGMSEERATELVVCELGRREGPDEGERP